MASRTQPRRFSIKPQQARFRSFSGQPQTVRRFARSAPARPPRRVGPTSAPLRRPIPRRRQSQPAGAKGLLQRLGSALPLGGSSGKRGTRATGAGKPAVLGLLGAGAAGAALLAKRRKGSSSSEVPAVQDGAASQTPTPVPHAARPDGPPAGEQPG